jgi:hypothetical protein
MLFSFRFDCDNKSLHRLVKRSKQTGLKYTYLQTWQRCEVFEVIPSRFIVHTVGT